MEKRTGESLNTPILSTIKEDVDKRISAIIVESLGMIPEAITLAQELTEITTYENYMKYLAKLNQYKIVTNGITTYLETLSKIDRVTNTKENEDIHYNQEIENLSLDLLKNSRTGVLHYEGQLTLIEVMNYMRNIWLKKEKLVFIQPNNTRVGGMITAEAWRGKKKIPIAYGWISEDEEGNTHHEVTLYSQRKLDRKTWSEKLVLFEEVYGYRLWDGKNHREFLVLSDKKLAENEREGVFDGALIEKNENLILGEDLRLGAYANVFHINNFAPNIQGIFMMSKYPEGFGGEVSDVRDNVRVSENEQKNTFTILVQNSIFNKFKHPSWFMNLIYYFLLSSSSYEYPLHIFIFQDGSGGKSTLLKRIAYVMGVSEEDIWSGNKSTIKSLIPNFHTNPPSVGWMPQQKVVGLLDEFFGRQSHKDKEDSLWEYDSIKDLLDHNKSASLSGKGNITTYATAKFLFCSNLKYGIRDLESFMRRTDAALVERCLVYFMNKEHEEFIRNNREDVMELSEEPEVFEGSNEFVKQAIHHAQSFKISGVDYKKVQEIRKRLLSTNSLDVTKYEAIENYVNARISHHLVCLLDGIVKYRYFNKKIWCGEFTPIDEDYVELESIAEIVSKSWSNDFNLNDFSFDARARMLSGHAREAYHFIKEQGGKVMEVDFFAYLQNVMKLETKTLEHTSNMLLEWGVIKKEDGYFKCFWKDLIQKSIKERGVRLDESHNGICGMCGYMKWLEFTLNGNHVCKECANE